MFRSGLLTGLVAGAAIGVLALAGLWAVGWGAAPAPAPLPMRLHKILPEPPHDHPADAIPEWAAAPARKK